MNLTEMKTYVCGQCGWQITVSRPPMGCGNLDCPTNNKPELIELKKKWLDALAELKCGVWLERDLAEGIRKYWLWSHYSTKQHDFGKKLFAEIDRQLKENK